MGDVQSNSLIRSNQKSSMGKKLIEAFTEVPPQNASIKKTHLAQHDTKLKANKKVNLQKSFSTFYTNDFATTHQDIRRTLSSDQPQTFCRPCRSCPSNKLKKHRKNDSLKKTSAENNDTIKINGLNDNAKKHVTQHPNKHNGVGINQKKNTKIKDQSKHTKEQQMLTGHSNDYLFDLNESLGINDFPESSEDNFVVESYNKDSKTLIIVFLEVTREPVSFVDNIEDADVVVCEKDNVLDYRTLKDNDNDTEPLIKSEDKNTSSSNKSEVVVYKDASYYNIYFKNERNWSTISDDSGIQLDQEDILEESIVESEKLRYIINELVETEEQYVLGLKKVVEVYAPLVDRMTAQSLFGNIVSIYKGANNFLYDLKKNMETPEEIAQVFLDSNNSFVPYIMYSKNKPIADAYLKKFEEKFKEKQRQIGDKLDLSSYLLTPIQRLGKYILILENIQKEVKKTKNSCNLINLAITNIKMVMRKGNDHIAIDSINNSPMDLTTQGSFLMREKFNMLKPKKIDCMVFLFENVIVFAQILWNNFEQFIYLEHIFMSDLRIAIFEEKELVFELIDYQREKMKTFKGWYTLEAKNAKIKSVWTKALSTRLWEQLTNVKKEVKQRSLNLESSV